MFEEFFFDIETPNRVLRQRDSRYTHSWTLTADDLTKDELLALFELKVSEAVYIMRQDGEVLGVIAEGLSTLYNRFSKTHIFTVQINFPRDFSPEKWLNDI